MSKLFERKTTPASASCTYCGKSGHLENMCCKKRRDDQQKNSYPRKPNTWKTNTGYRWPYSENQWSNQSPPTPQNNFGRSNNSCFNCSERNHLARHWTAPRK
uniref:CCHC-type domain-containing protein n=1 Tax=Romanomermis culicivorax TaxID=13658 RepID=A0A915JQL6_ROMCU